MGVNKVTLNDPIKGEEVVLDLTGDTIKPEYLNKGITAHDASGEPIVGTREDETVLLRTGFCGKTEADEVYYDFYSDGTLVLRGNGKTATGWITEDEETIAPWFTEDDEFMYEIKKVIIEDGIITISNGCFLSCINIESVIMADSVVVIDYDAFDYCLNLSYVKLSKNITTISDWAFASCENLADINLPDSVTDIGESAFAFCYELESISIPKGITTIRYSLFTDNFKLKNVHIPDGVTSIQDGAFLGCESLEEIVLPSSLETIGREAFGDTGLKDIVIPNSVQNISYMAFYYCLSLENVYFSGKKAEWDAINIEDGNEALLSATLHCEYDPNADTVDGWNVDVIIDGSDPEDTTEPTLHFIFTVG